MRIGLGNVLTTEEHLRKGWEIIQETADALCSVAVRIKRQSTAALQNVASLSNAHSA